MNTPPEDLIVAARPLDRRAYDIVLERAAWNDALEWTDWRFHIPDPLRQIWSKLSHEARLALYVMAEPFAKILTHLWLLLVPRRTGGGDDETLQLRHIRGIRDMKERHSIPTVSVPITEVLIEALRQV